MTLTTFSLILGIPAFIAVLVVCYELRTLNRMIKNRSEYADKKV